MCARSLWLCGVAVVTMRRGTRALVGGYSQHLYGPINQSKGSVLCPREKGGQSTETEQKREKEGGWGVVCVA